MNKNNKNKGKKRNPEDDQLNNYPSFKLTRVNTDTMDADFPNNHLSLTPSPSSPGSSSSHSAPNYYLQYGSQETAIMISNAPSQNEVFNELELMNLSNNDPNLRENAKETAAREVCCVGQSVSEFAPLVGTFFKLGEEIIKLYESARHNKELCSFLLKRCNAAIAAVRDLDIRKTENMEFFSKTENLTIFFGFVGCMKKMKKFISRVSRLNKLVKYFLAASIEDDFKNLVAEFDGYMGSLKFSFMMQSRDESSQMRDEIRQIKDVLFNIFEIPADKKSCQEYLEKMDLVTSKNIKYQLEQKPDSDSSLNTSEIDESEPLMSGKFQKTFIPLRKVEKYMSYNSCDEYFFKEIPSNTYPNKSQYEVRKEVNILKELKNSNHIIKFYGVAKEDTKYYLVTEWMEYGDLHEYYTTFRDSITLQMKINFALDICRGIAYLHECKILHRDIQSANILINGNHKAKITNFGLSRKFSEITRNIAQNLENIRYLAPEKLLLDNEEDGTPKPKKVSYDAKCEVYSVGVLLWEIAELCKPHSDLKKEDMLVSIRNRVIDGYRLPFSKDIPCEWEYIVARAMEYDPNWRPNISDICREFYRMGKKYSNSRGSIQSHSSQSSICTEIESVEHYKSKSVSSLSSISSFVDDDTIDANIPYITVKIISVEDAVRIHKSENGNKKLAWHSFKYHSSTDLEAKYWLGYYYYHDKEIFELKQINKDERIKIAEEIFKETADKGNPSAQLRYGMCIWKENSIEALRYLKMSADSGNSAAMYIVGKAYWNGGNGIGQDKNQGARYLQNAAKQEHPKAIKLCHENNINY